MCLKVTYFPMIDSNYTFPIFWSSRKWLSKDVPSENFRWFLIIELILLEFGHSSFNGVKATESDALRPRALKTISIDKNSLLFCLYWKVCFVTEIFRISCSSFPIIKNDLNKITYHLRLKFSKLSYYRKIIEILLDFFES